jgi:hypothetical protein
MDRDHRFQQQVVRHPHQAIACADHGGLGLDGDDRAADLTDADRLPNLEGAADEAPGVQGPCHLSSAQPEGEGERARGSRQKDGDDDEQDVRRKPDLGGGQEREDRERRDLGELSRAEPRSPSGM